MTNKILLHYKQQHEDCFISIHGGLPKDRTSAHLSDKEGRRYTGQEYHQSKSKLHPTGVGTFPKALRMHVPNILWRISLITTGHTLGHLSRLTSRPATMALYANQGG